MLGRTFRRRWGSAHELVSPSRGALDLADASSTLASVRAATPEVVVHCAAYTKVDEAESDEAAAFLGNERVTANVADAARDVGARLVAFSTDYVFSGELNRPYAEDDAPAPRSVYGKSKLAGEVAARARHPDPTIVRVAWLYGPGGPSFLHTICRLAADPERSLTLVDDQVGNPTTCDAVVSFVEQCLESKLTGLLHGTCEGETSWFGFGSEVLQRLGLEREVAPCSTDAFPRAAPRPANSRLENRRARAEGIVMPTWEAALEAFICENSDELLPET